MTENDQEHEHDHSQCRALLGSLSEYIDGTLQAEICAQIEKHMEGCENCRVVVDTMRKTVEIYHETGQEVGLPGAVRQRLFFRLHLEDFLKPEESQTK